MNYFIFQVKFKKAIYFSSVQLFVGIVLEIALYLVFPLLGIANIEILNNSLFLKVSVSLSIYFTSYYLLTRKRIIKSINSFTDRVEGYATYEIFFLILMIVFNIVTVTSGANYEDLEAITNYLLFTIVVLILGIVILNINIKSNTIEEKNENLLSDIKQHEIITEDYRVLKHNLLNDLLIIKTSSPDSGLIVDEMIGKYKNDYAWISQINSLPYGLKGLIHLKLNAIKNSDIRYSLESNIDKDFFNKMKKSHYVALCSAIGIYLDNAIEAAKNSINKTIYVGMTKTNDRICISIINSFNNPINVNMIGLRNYSSKEVKSGIGLFFAKNILNRKFEVSRLIVDDMFVTKIFIQQKKLYEVY